MRSPLTRSVEGVYIEQSDNGSVPIGHLDNAQLMQRNIIAAGSSAHTKRC